MNPSQLEKIAMMYDSRKLVKMEIETADSVFHLDGLAKIVRSLPILGANGKNSNKLSKTYLLQLIRKRKNILSAKLNNKMSKLEVRLLKMQLNTLPKPPKGILLKKKAT